MEAASGGYHEVGRILVEHVSGEGVLVSWTLGGGPVGEGEGTGQPCVDVPETPSPPSSHRVLT